MITDYTNTFVRQHVLAHIMKFTDKKNPVGFILQMPEVIKADSVYWGIAKHIQNGWFLKNIEDKRAFLYDTLQFMPGDKEMADDVVTASYEYLVANEASMIVVDYKKYITAKNYYNVILEKAGKVFDDNIDMERARKKYQNE